VVTLLVKRLAVVMGIVILTTPSIRAAESERGLRLSLAREVVIASGKTGGVDITDPKTRRLSDRYVAIYRSVFSIDELRAQLRFFQSPAGRSYVSKSKELTRRLLSDSSH